MGEQRRQKASHSQIEQILVDIAEEHEDKDRVLVNVVGVCTRLEEKYGISLSPKTVRRYGIHPSGKFAKNYGDGTDYNHTGDPKKWGLILYPEKFLEQIKQDGES